MPRHNGTGVELLADPTRRQIISLVALRPRRPSAIARDLGVHRSTATHQLRLLEKAGLIMSRRTRHDGRGMLYLLDPQRVGQVIAWLAGTEVGGPFGEAAGEAAGLAVRNRPGEAAGLAVRNRPGEVVRKPPSAADSG